MKTLLSIILIALASLISNAQITFNGINLNIGDVVLQAVDTNFQTALLSPGTDLTWDFSGVHGQRTDTIAPIDPTTTNHGSSFTNSNLAFGTPELAGYSSLTSNEFVSLGFGGYIASIDQDVEMIYDIPDTSIVFPLNYSDNRTSYSWGQAFANVQGQDMRMSQSTQRTQNCDAWGTVTTPHDTYDVLRVQELEINIDSVFAIIFGQEAYQSDYSTFDTTYRYSFYTNDPTIKYPLLEVKYDYNADTILETKWITFLPNNTQNISKQSTDISIYPNPSSDFINIDTQEGIVDVKIYNTNGQVVKTSQHKNIDISDLPTSMYFVEIKTEKGTYRKKILVK